MTNYTTDEEGLKKALDVQTISEDSNDFSDLEKLGKVKTDSLKESIEDIEKMVSERRALGIKFDKEAEQLKTQINDTITENIPMGIHDTEILREKVELRKKQIDISEIQLKERIDSWKDIALLKKELREKEKELNEKESRMKILGELLE